MSETITKDKVIKALKESSIRIIEINTTTEKTEKF